MIQNENQWAALWGGLIALALLAVHFGAAFVASSLFDINYFITAQVAVALVCLEAAAWGKFEQRRKRRQNSDSKQDE